ncbi:EAL domain-containing protein [Niveibacterium sp. 24ML]|uniref:EAL domain-containing protein n=1 Tax=Niveibacterium sp. 24ML TaxID=2985512 RepID=UPI0022716906|nr:EAL domain-containing protein [Niveibacterium sp. 24ML]MCX9155596.1 EAL domain-containing protein [Niveibacterium sp. 24ML]
MKRPTTRILLVEADQFVAERVIHALSAPAVADFRVHRVTRLADALDWLKGHRASMVLLNLSLPDQHGIGAYLQVSVAAPDAAMLLLYSGQDEPIAREGVSLGAHGYIATAPLDAGALPQLCQHVIAACAAQRAVRDSEARFRAISDASPLGILVSDKDDHCVYANTVYQTIVGTGQASALGASWFSTIHPDDQKRVRAEWRHALHTDQRFQSELRLCHPDEPERWVRVHSAALPRLRARHGHVLTFEDITGRKADEAVLRAAEDALFDERERAQVTLNSIGDAVLATDVEGKVSYLNVVAERLTGWPSAEALGRPLSEVFRTIDGEDRTEAANPALLAIRENRTVGLAAGSMLIRRDGSEAAIEDSAAPIHNRHGAVVGAVIVFHDVSESRAMTVKMAHLAQHDFLTDLPNRVLLTERLSQAIRFAVRHRKQTGLLFLDLDHFKHINDSLGHAIGDQLLKSVANRLRTCVRTTDTVCRQGGDEFVILLAEIERREDAAHISEKILAAFAPPHPIGGQELHVSLSIGISIYPDDAQSLDSMMQNADTAMYYAKAAGRNNYQFFQAEMNAQAVQRLFLENGLRRALKRKEFVLHYQPKVNIASGAITGVEALLRWQEPTFGLIGPGQFVPIAETCGLIVPIGRWVLRQACEQLIAWQRAGLEVVPVSVNISALEFRHPLFIHELANVLAQTAIEPSLLELELTESVLMHDAEISATALEALKHMGIQLAIDDFGTGYSSLSYLRRFPISTLKIDQSFVRDIETDADNATIVGAVIGMGRNLKQRVIAEGVETAEQLAFLRRERCDEGQGFLFSYPLLPDALGRLLAPRPEPVLA